MIPNIDLLLTEIKEITIPSNTYKIEVKTNAENDRINGYTDDLEAIQQSIYLILNTERYKYIIYSWDYGIELIDLFGQPMSYVIAEIPRRITDALLQDNRITNVTNFEFEINNHKIHTTFTVETESGNVETELEVSV